jgi:hypothetical protein
MRKTIAIACVVAPILLGNLSVSAIAVPLQTSNNGQDYYIGVEDLKQWSCGLYTETMERKLTNVGEPQSQAVLNYERTMGYIGYDILPYATTYATIGFGNLKIGEGFPASNNSAEYGVGVHFNLLDKGIWDPTLTEDKIRVTASMEYIASNPSVSGYGMNNSNINFDELSGSLIVSLVNDVQGNKTFLPFSLSLFGGLLYSDLTTNVHSVKQDGEFGFIAGLEVFYTESVSMFGAAQEIGDPGYSAGLNVRF